MLVHPMKILVAEDDAELGNLIADGLTERRFLVDLVGSVESAEAMMADNAYRVLVCDRGLPDEDGLSLVSRLRRRNNATPVLILSAMTGTANRIHGLDSGADDYLEKPFDMNELAARLHALGRRTQNMEPREFKAGKLSFDTLSRTATTPNSVVRLSNKEAHLLEQFMSRMGVTVLRSQLEQAIYSVEDDITPNALEAHISRLRKKLNAADACLHIHNMPGIGYLMTEMN